MQQRYRKRYMTVTTDPDAQKCAFEQIGSALPISQTSTPVEISTRIRSLAAQGLKPRDISALLGVHPQMVLLLLDEVTHA